MLDGLWILILLLGGSAFFSASETAFTSLSLMQIKEIQKRKPRLGRLLERLYHTPDIIVTTILIGNNIVNTSIATLSSHMVNEASGNVNLGLLTGIVTLAILVFGEVTPKQVAFLANVQIASFSIRILYVLSLVFRPLIWFLSIISKLIGLFRGSKGRSTVTVEGIIHMVQHARSIGLLEEYESRMVKSVFRFSDVTARGIMTHRTEVFSLSKDLTISEALPGIIEAGNGQIPVYDEDPEVIAGVVREKDLIRYMSHNEGQMKLSDVMVQPVFVQESWKVQRVFSKLKKEKSHMAIVLDEYGGLAGLLTINDLVSQIIGDLEEEDGSLSTRFPKDAEGGWVLPADEPLFVAEDLSGLEALDASSSVSIAGYIEDVLGRIPEQAESIETPIGTFTVVKAKRNKLESVRFFAAKPGDS